MKSIPFLKRTLGTLAFLAVSSFSVQAQTPDFTVNNFDSDAETGAWIRWWGNALQTYEHDSLLDADNNSTSGSLKATIEFDRTIPNGENQFALVGAFPENAVIDGSQYTNLVFDLRWDPNSPKRSGGDFGFLEIGFRRSDSSQLWLAPLTVPATAGDGWMRVTLGINPAATGVDQLTGIVFKMWSGDPLTGFTGTTTFWIDNVHL
ncbi:MAG TPA: hypothetical protein VM735_02060, partial [Candidatus Kapabacteria bacterium]|nr:hypothetical protein [Candidatus Kapabacteria bacterium]